MITEDGEAENVVQLDENLMEGDNEEKKNEEDTNEEKMNEDGDNEEKKDEEGDNEEKDVGPNLDLDPSSLLSGPRPRLPTTAEKCCKYMFQCQTYTFS